MLGYAECLSRFSDIMNILKAKEKDLMKVISDRKLERQKYLHILLKNWAIVGVPDC
jgi:hypothetical protein